ncbi:MAG: TldD/PmbA family protein [archaeon]|nr:TldD/PmbA family protein [archaeon]
MVGDLQVDERYHKRLQKLKERYKIQYFNARFSTNLVTSLHINKGNMKSAHIINDYGFSIQAFINGGYGFSASNTISLDELEKRFEEASKLAKFASKKAEKVFKIDELDPINEKFTQPQKINLLDVDQEEKLKFLLEQDKNARNFDKRIVNTNSVYADSIKNQILITSDGRIIELQENYARALIFSYSKEGDINQSSRASKGIAGGFEISEIGKDLGITSAKRAIEILKAKPVNAGKYNVILDPLLCGTFIHEAFGHAAEADAVLAGESMLEGMQGKKVGLDSINIIDDPSLDSTYGSIRYDSECVRGKKVHIVKNGILNEFLHNRETASKMGVEPTGNGRAQSFKSVPVVRMTSTYMDKGDLTLEEMIEDLKDGILCINWIYGYTEPSIGQFMFKMERAWEIKNGEKVQLLRDAALSGMMLEALNKISGIGNTIDLDDGTCGKGGQGAPVSSGGPYLKIDDVVIGGM